MATSWETSRAIHLEDYLGLLGKEEENLFVTFSPEGKGFAIQTGHNPTAKLQVTAQTSKEEILDFVKSHQGKLVVFLLSYDYGRVLHHLPVQHEMGASLGYLYAYEGYLRFSDKDTQICGQDFRFTKNLTKILERKPPKFKQARLKLEEPSSLTAYEEKVGRLIDYIKKGDIYQLNYTEELAGQYPGSGVDLFVKLAQSGRPGYGGYLNTGDFEMISLSPESFLESYGRKIVTRPIKGTRPLGSSNEEKMEATKNLLSSTKEEAELFMITDLLRNDIGMSSQVGSVEVRAHKKTMKIRGVIHSYSEVQGKLLAGLHPFEALLNAFPGGSVTGCPKRRAMEIIEEVEGRQRGFYTGSFGYIDERGFLKANILIRTLFKRNDELRFAMGGGITALSNAKEEYQEMLHKRDSVIGGVDE